MSAEQRFETRRQRPEYVKKTNPEYKGHGVRITIMSASTDGRILDSDEYPVVKGSLVGDMGFLSEHINSENLYKLEEKKEPPHQRSRTKHRFFQGFTEFFDMVDQGIYPQPEYLKASRTGFRMARFLGNWLGGDLALADMPAYKEVSDYDYAVRTEVARKRLLSEQTQAEIARLAPLRDAYDEGFRNHFPEHPVTDPRLPENDTPASIVFMKRWGLRY